MARTDGRVGDVKWRLVVVEVDVRSYESPRSSG